MNIIQQLKEKKMDKGIIRKFILSSAQSLSEISNNITRMNILECLRGLHESKKITDDEYAAELKSLLKRYNFELDCDKERG